MKRFCKILAITLVLAMTMPATVLAAEESTVSEFETTTAEEFNEAEPKETTETAQNLTQEIDDLTEETEEVLDILTENPEGCFEEVEESEIGEDQELLQETYTTIKPYPAATYELKLLSDDNETYWVVRGFDGTASGDLVIPDEYNGLPIKEIFSNSFLINNEEETGNFTGSIQIGNNITKIGYNAFRYCKFTGELVVPSSVTEIQHAAFADCINITNISLNAQIDTISEMCFYNCKGITGELTIPSQIKTIDRLAFFGCNNVTKINLPNGLETIGGNAFVRTGKGTIVIPASVTTIDPVNTETGNTSPSFDMARFEKVVNNSNCTIRLFKNTADEPEKKYYWTNALTGEKITSIANGAAIRHEEGSSSGEDSTYQLWGFSNIEDNYGNPANGYCIDQQDYNRAISNLPATARADYANNYNINGTNARGITWAGSCYGMSTSTLRINDGSDSFADYGLGSKFAKLSDVKAADEQYKGGGNDSIGKAESVINFYHYQQLLPEYQTVRATFASYTKQKQVEEVAKLAKTAQSDKRPAVIDLWWNENGNITGHSINVIGYRELASSENLYATYPHCILTYDCSNPETTGNNSAYNVYFDDAGNWTVPGWEITPANARMICGSNDPSVVGPVDYKTGAYAGTASMPASISYDGDDGAWEFQWSDNEVEVNGADLTENITDDDTVILLPEATDQNNHSYRIYIPEDKDYTITGDIIDHTIRINDQMIKINAEEGGRAVIKQNGEVTVEADDNGQIVIEIISDNDNGNAPSHVILTAEDADELVGQITDDGIIVKGSDLSNLEIQSDNIKTMVHSEESEVLVVQNDDGTIDIFEDKDHNGTFDDPVEAEAVGFTHSKIPAQTYTGTKLTPDVKVYFEGRLLKKGTDYTVKYANNTNVTTKATVTITGKGNFTGSDTETFEIKAKNIEDPDVKVSDITSASYNKKKNYTPVPTVTYKGKKLKNKTDFNVAYFSDEICKTSVTPQNGGKYYAKVTGIKNFTGSKVIPFEIAATEQIPVSKLTIGKIPDQKYTGEQRTPAPVVKNGKNPLAENTHYTLSWGTNTEIGTGTVTITGIEPYVGTRTVTFNITGVPMNKTNIEIVPAICVYSGEAQTPLITSLYYKAEKRHITHATQAEYNAMTEEEKKAVDCIVSYKNNTNAGTATITLKGIHGATGTINKTFKIQPFPVENRPGDPPGCPFKVELASETYPYAKGGTRPVPIVTFEGIELENNKDYRITYLNNGAVTTDRTKKLPTVKITGIGNFTGTDTTATFKITKADMTETGIKVIANDVVYKNKKGNWKTKYTVVGPDGKALKAGTDYNKTVQFTLEDGVTTINGNDILDAETVVKIKVTGEGAYTGTVTGEYKIVKQDIKALAAEVSPKIYTGEAITITKDDIIWKLKRAKVNDVTFTIDESTYENNVNASTKKKTATVTVYGTGNYGGKTTVSYRIDAKKISWWWKLLNP